MSEYERLKAQEDEILQREREALERPPLAEIDTLRLRIRSLEAALWKIAQWQDFDGVAAYMRECAFKALEKRN